MNNDIITQEKIEDAVIQYITDKCDKPKFVLMDEKSYKQYTESFIPREKVDLALPDEAKDSAPGKIYTTIKCSVEILEVKSDKAIFEVIG